MTAAGGPDWAWWQAMLVGCAGVWWLDPVTLPSGDRLVEGHVLVW